MNQQNMNKNWVKIGITIIVTVIIMYAMIYVDVVLRARSSYMEGEKYRAWHENPAQKKIDLDKTLESELKKLDKKLASNKIKKDEYGRSVEIVKFNHDRKLEESSIKYAYVWYQTTVELFSPPESKWVKLARKKMPVAKEQWKQELRKKNIPFEDYMID